MCRRHCALFLFFFFLFLSECSSSSYLPTLETVITSTSNSICSPFHHIRLICSFRPPPFALVSLGLKLTAVNLFLILATASRLSYFQSLCFPSLSASCSSISLFFLFSSSPLHPSPPSAIDLQGDKKGTSPRCIAAQERRGCVPKGQRVHRWMNQE